MLFSFFQILVMARKTPDDDEINRILFEESDDSDGEQLDFVPIYQGSGDMPEKDTRTPEIGSSSEGDFFSPLDSSSSTMCGALSDSGADTPLFVNVRKKRRVQGSRMTPRSSVQILCLLWTCTFPRVHPPQCNQ